MPVKAHALSRYSPDAVGARYRALYDAVLEHGP